jgi:hypothetical protein
MFNIMLQIRGLPGLWFAFYTPLGLFLALESEYWPALSPVVCFLPYLAILNLILLYCCRRGPDGRERLWTRLLFAFIPAISATTVMIYFRPNFNVIGSLKLNYIFNMMYATAVFGFWLPRDEVYTCDEAKNYYEEYKYYLWPAIFLTVVSFASGVWTATLNAARDGALKLTVEDFSFLAYIGLGFGSGALCVYSHVDTCRRRYLELSKLDQLRLLTQKIQFTIQQLYQRKFI